jgi:hypothetical protein
MSESSTTTTTPTAPAATHGFRALFGSPTLSDGRHIVFRKRRRPDSADGKDTKSSSSSSSNEAAPSPAKRARIDATSEGKAARSLDDNDDGRDDVQLPLHAAVAFGRSLYFQTMLTTPMREGNGEDVVMEAETERERRCQITVVKFMYTQDRDTLLEYVNTCKWDSQNTVAAAAATEPAKTAAAADEKKKKQSKPKAAPLRLDAPVSETVVAWVDLLLLADAYTVDGMHTHCSAALSPLVRNDIAAALYVLNRVPDVSGMSDSPLNIVRKHAHDAVVAAFKDTNKASVRSVLVKLSEDVLAMLLSSDDLLVPTENCVASIALGWMRVHKCLSQKLWDCIRWHNLTSNFFRHLYDCGHDSKSSNSSSSSSNDDATDARTHQMRLTTQRLAPFFMCGTRGRAELARAMQPVPRLRRGYNHGGSGSTDCFKTIVRLRVPFETCAPTSTTAQPLLRLQKTLTRCTRLIGTRLAVSIGNDSAEPGHFECRLKAIPYMPRIPYALLSGDLQIDLYNWHSTGFTRFATMPWTLHASKQVYVHRFDESLPSLRAKWANFFSPQNKLRFRITINVNDRAWWMVRKPAANAGQWCLTGSERLAEEEEEEDLADYEENEPSD